MGIRRPSPIALLCGGLALVYVGRGAEYLLGADGLYDQFGYVIGRDFIVFWLAAKLTLQGDVARVIDPAGFRYAMEAAFRPSLPVHLWLYPSHYLLFIWPFGLLPYVGALLAWWGSTLALFLGAALAGLAARWQAVVVLALAPSTYTNVLLGQNGFLCGALLIAGLRLLQDRPVLAGVCFGLLTVKPQLGLLLPVALLALGAWRAIFSAAATAAVLVGLSVLLFGGQAWLDFAVVTRGQQALLLHTPATGVHLLMVTPFGAVVQLGGSPVAGLALNGFTALVAAAVTWWAYRQPAPAVLRHAVLVLATCFAAPYVLTYDLPVLSAMLVWLWLRAPDFCRPLGIRALLLVVWMVPLAQHLAMGYGVPLAQLALAAMLFLLLRRIRDQRAGGAVSE
jgi:hypothetical protein